MKLVYQDQQLCGWAEPEVLHPVSGVRWAAEHVRDGPGRHKLGASLSSVQHRGQHQADQDVSLSLYI